MNRSKYGDPAVFWREARQRYDKPETGYVKVRKKTGVEELPILHIVPG
jgi:hypothetical protein